MRWPRGYLIETFLVWVIIPILIVVTIQIPKRNEEFRQERYETFKTIAGLMAPFVGGNSLPAPEKVRMDTDEIAVWYSLDGEDWRELGGKTVVWKTGSSEIVQKSNQRGLVEMHGHLGYLHAFLQDGSLRYLFVGEKVEALENEGWRQRADYIFLMLLLTGLICLGYTVIRKDITQQVSSFRDELESVRTGEVQLPETEYRVIGELQEVFTSSKQLLAENILVSSILHNLPVGLVVLDENDQVALINRRMEEYVGVDADVLVGQQLDSTPLSFMQEAPALSVTGASGEEGRHTPALVVDRRGRFAEVHAFPLDDRNGKNLGTLYMVLDSVDRVMLERLQLENGFFIESTGTGVVVINDRNIIISINDHAATCFGVERSEALQADWTEFGPARVPQIYQLTGSFPEPGVLKDRNVTLNQAESPRYIRLDSFLLGQASGKSGPAALMLLLRDETEKHLLEEQARLADKLAVIGQMAAGTAHEIRNPLTGIRGFVQLIEKALIKHDLKEQAEYVPMILAEIDRINEIIKDFLLLAKPAKATEELFDVNQAVAECLVFVENETLLREVEMVVRYADGLPPVRGEMDKLKQVVLNLARNALEAMPGGGRLEVGTRSDGNWIVIEIRDTGEGIPADKLQKIFEPFFTTKEGGTGLGLPVSYKIVQDFGGELTAESEVGKGTLFQVRLPTAGLESEKRSDSL